MKLNKKGFTLVELLAVVVILLAISVIAVSSISAAIERNKAKQNDAKIDVIISYAKLYYDEHKNQYGSTICINIDDLERYGYLSDSERMNAYNEKFEGVVKYNSGKWQFINNDNC